MATKIKVPVGTTDAEVVEVPEHNFLTERQADADWLHGDGLWPIYKDKMAKVTPGTGLQVLINDYYALIDGMKVGVRAKKRLDWTIKVPLSVPVGENYILLRPLTKEDFPLPKNVDGTVKKEKDWTPGDWDECRKYWDHGAGVFYIAPDYPKNKLGQSEGCAVIAKLTIPNGTTQVTEAMIDNSVKTWLQDVGSLSAMTKYADKAVEEAKREIYRFMLGEFTNQIRDEIAQGDAAVRTELDNRCNVIQNQINDLTVDVNTIRASLADFQTYVNSKIATLTTKTDALSEALTDLGDTVSETEAMLYKIQEQVGKMEGDILANQIAIQNNLNRIEKLETTGLITTGLFDFTNAINIGKTNFKIDSQMKASANAMYNGFVNVFADVNGIDSALSSGFQIDKVRQIIKVSGALPSGLVSLWHMDEGLGNLIQDSFGTNNGLISGAAWSTGKFGKCLSFDGIDDYVETTNIGIFGRVPVSFSFWVKENAVGASFCCFKTFISVGPNSANNIAALSEGHIYGVSVPTPTLVNINHWSDTNVYGIDISPCNYVTDWVFLVYTYDGNTEKVFANGVEKYSRSGITLNFIGNPVRMGGRPGGYPSGDYYINGLLDEVAIYNRALTAEEVLEIYNSEKPIGSGDSAAVVTSPYTASSSPSNALLVADDKGDVTYQVSRDNGTTWTAITKNTLFNFTTEPAGTQMRVKAALNEPTAELDNLALFWK